MESSHGIRSADLGLLRPGRLPVCSFRNTYGNDDAHRSFFGVPLFGVGDVPEKCSDRNTRLEALSCLEVHKCSGDVFLSEHFLRI